MGTGNIGTRLIQFCRSIPQGFTLIALEHKCLTMKIQLFTVSFFYIFQLSRGKRHARDKFQDVNRLSGGN